MIPRAHITAWRRTAPWSTDAQVEQDLVISRALTDLYSDPVVAKELAFRGGTALNKLHLKPAARYSEDIDLVQVNAGPIGAVVNAARARLDAWLGEPTWKQGEGRFTLSYRFESEMKPVTPLKLKVEINTREHLFVLGAAQVAYDVDSPWHQATASILTYQPEELLGTKLRALYQRKKGRDLFDLAASLERMANLDLAKIVECFERYVSHGGTRITRDQFEKNLAGKLRDRVFLGDVPPLLVDGEKFDAEVARERIDLLIAKLPAGRKRARRR